VQIIKELRQDRWSHATPKERLNKYQIPEDHPSGAKARVDDAYFCGTADAVPFQSISICHSQSRAF
jgi:hypothetical protein